MASTGTGIVKVRPAKSHAEATHLWWPLMVSLAWNRSFLDLGSYISATRSQGLLVAIPDDFQEPVGHVMATIYDNSTGWVTLFVVRPDHQAKGFGRALFDAAMQEFKLNATQIVGLDSVVQQKATYERRGFIESPLGKIRCMSWNIRAEVDSPVSYGLQQDLRVIDIKDVPHKFLVESDFNHTGFLRKGLWNDELLTRPDLFGFALVHGEHANKFEDIRAWTIVRRVPLGFRMGPVYAADKQSAQTVILAGMERATREVENASSVPAEPHRGAVNLQTRTLTAEIWDGNPNAMSLFGELGWTSLGVDYHRMWLNGKATPQQSGGGLAHSGMFAVFDAAIG